MALTAAQIAAINSVTRYWDRSGHFELGTIINGVLSDYISGTPVNAVNAVGTLTLTGVVKNGETLTIGEDVYECVTSSLGILSSPSNIPFWLGDFCGFGAGTLTLAVQPTVGDTFTIGSNVYTFVTAGEASDPGEVSVGSDLATAKLAVVAAIMGTDGRNIPHPLVTISAFDGNDAAMIAIFGGTQANTISTVETFANIGNVFSATTLLGGTDCTAADADDEIINTITNSGTEPVTATQGAGTTVTLTANVPGVLANGIATTETMANASFGHAHLLGGIDGTVGTVVDRMYDASYIYFLIANNTITGKNWRRISLGSAF